MSNSPTGPQSIKSSYIPFLQSDGLEIPAEPADMPFRKLAESLELAEPDSEKPVLNQHHVSSVAFTIDASGKASFFASLFSGETEMQRVGVVQEAKSFAVVQKDGKEVEVGVAVRLQVKADKFSASAQVTIPNITAEAQLGLSRADMEISVRGFSGPLGKLLPAPKSVDITSYTEYLDAFREIQAHVFSDASRQHFSPVVLGAYKPPTG